MSTYDAYFAAVATADPVRAVAALDEALDRGEPHDSLVGVVARGQREVGRLWFEGRWTVADEHAATAVAEQALAMIAPPRAAAPGAARVVLACAEGEWHTMPARLAAALARTPELDVVPLGGSVPAEHLARHLRGARPAALALSCTMATNLVGAARTIAAAHEEGVPVVVGGAAWGPGRHRADRLGADLRLDDPAALGRAVAALDVLPAREPEGLPVEAMLLDEPRHETLLRALERHGAASAWVRRTSEYARQRTVEDLRLLCRYAAAAIACDDPTVLREMLAWLVELLAPRAVPAAVVLDGCGHLADAVEAETPSGARLLRAEAELAYRAVRVPAQGVRDADRARE